MKKTFILSLVSLALVAFIAAPAVAELKLTTKGYMKVQGVWTSGGPTDSTEVSNAWHNMEMIIKPIFHINDKVRIFSQIRIMERNWSGDAGRFYVSDAAEDKYNIFGDEQTISGGSACTSPSRSMAEPSI